MATTGPINTTALTISVRTATTPSVVYTKIARCNDASLSISHDPRDITTKDSNGWSESLEGLRSAEMSLGSLYAYDDTIGADYMTQKLIDRAQVKLRFTTGATGDKVYEAFGYITNSELGSPGFEDTATASISVKITGEVTVATL